MAARVATEAIAYFRVGSLHGNRVAQGGTQAGRTKLAYPRAPSPVPKPSDAECMDGGGWERVRRDHRVGGSVEATAQSER